MSSLPSRSISPVTLSTTSFLNCFDDGETACCAAAYSKAIARLRGYLRRESSRLQSCSVRVYSSWPYVPPLDIIHFDMRWSLGRVRKVRINSHLHNNFGAAVVNINSAGRTLLDSEEDSLHLHLSRYILSLRLEPSVPIIYPDPSRCLIGVK